MRKLVMVLGVAVLGCATSPEVRESATPRPPPKPTNLVECFQRNDWAYDQCKADVASHFDSFAQRLSASTDQTGQTAERQRRAYDEQISECRWYHENNVRTCNARFPALAPPPPGDSPALREVMLPKDWKSPAQAANETCLTQIRAHIDQCFAAARTKADATRCSEAIGVEQQTCNRLFHAILNSRQECAETLGQLTKQCLLGATSDAERQACAITEADALKRCPER